MFNWGTSKVPDWYQRAIELGVRVINSPEAVANAANKLTALRILSSEGISVPQFTTSNADAAAMVRQGHVVYARRALTGHSGAGIVVIEPHPTINTTQVVEAPLYTRAVRTHGEYRVHVVNGQVIDYIKKRRRHDDHPTREQNLVRNLDNGWVYTRENLRRIERVENIAIAAVSALALDFGAVDIINDNDGNVYVLEVNTACGMSDTTLESYSSAFNSITDEINANS